MTGWQPEQYSPPQQVAPYQQQGWQPQYPPPAYAQPYQQQPVVAPKSTAAGLVLGLIIPGTGCMYAGRPWIGVAILALWLVSIPLFFVGIGLFTGLAAWIASAILGYTLTRAWNAEHGIVS